MKDKKGQLTIGGIVIVLIAIFVALALGTQIFNTQSLLTTKQTITNETLNYSNASETSQIDSAANFTITNAPTGWRYIECPLESLTVVGTNGSTFTLNTDYRVNLTNGTIWFYNTTRTWYGSNTPNISQLTYTFCDLGYNKDSGSRGIASLIGLITAIALIVFIAGYGLREWLNR